MENVKNIITTSIHSIKEIEILREVNGIAIEQIEKRGLPIHDNTTDVEWRFRSFDGFLAENESFKKILMDDWNLVQQLGVNNAELALHLKNIIQSVEEKRKSDNLGLMTPITVTYQAKSKHISAKKAQQFHVTHQLFNGYQYSLFTNSEVEDSPLNSKWNEEYIVQNTETHLQIKMAGNAKYGIVQFIELLGFYEGGGVYNAYRIDPELLLCILLGKSTPRVIELTRQQQELLLIEPTNELNYCKEKFESCKEKLDSNAYQDPNIRKLLVQEFDWLKERQQYLADKIEKQKQETSEFVLRLGSYL